MKQVHLHRLALDSGLPTSVKLLAAKNTHIRSLQEGRFPKALFKRHSGLAGLKIPLAKWISTLGVGYAIEAEITTNLIPILNPQPRAGFGRGRA